jgi:bacillithiol biosynthesis cysteine-adding enzyme BshC
MESFCLRQTELPGTTKLFADLLYHYDRVRQFYPNPPASFDSCLALSQTVTAGFPIDRRAALVRALAQLNGADNPMLARLAEPGTVAVLTGQQVGLFSGPAYSVYKALTAVRVAQDLTAAGQPAVPVFWLASEDHDFAEVNHVWMQNAQGQPVRINGQTGANSGPVGAVVLENPPLDELRQTLADLPLGAEVHAQIAKHYASGTFASSFLGLMKDWLGRFGLLFVDPLDPAIRAIFSPLMAEAARLSTGLRGALLDRGKALTEAGYHAQVHVEPDSSLFFLLEDGQRKSLKFRNGEYTLKDRKWTPEELAGLGPQLSPNALLRPVMQDYLFPTVSVVGGPAELAYFAQSAVLYERLLGHMPVSTPRAGFTLLTARAQKLLNRHGLTVQQCWHGEEAVREAIAAHLVPASVTNAMGSAQTCTRDMLDFVAKQLENYDRTLVAALEKSRAKIQHQLGKIERKVARETLRRNERAAAEAAYLSHHLFPEKHLQERLYSFVPMLATYGEELFDRILDHIRIECVDHQVIAL